MGEGHLIPCPTLKLTKGDGSSGRSILELHQSYNFLIFASYTPMPDTPSTMTPGDVEALFQSQLSSDGEALTQERTELLRDVCGTLRETERQGLEAYVEKLANGSRDREFLVLHAELR